MTRHDNSVALRHMLDHAREAVSMTRGRSRDDLERDRTLGLAVVRLLEIIGEAATRVPAVERDRCPGVLWGEIVGMRNRLIHGYDAVDFDIVWSVLKHDLPELVLSLEKIVPADEH
jgi:uncharacterized protein with HEPN domain